MTRYLCPAGNPLVMDDYIYGVTRGGREGKYRGIWLHAPPWNRGRCPCTYEGWPPFIRGGSPKDAMARRLAVEED